MVLKYRDNIMFLRSNTHDLCGTHFLDNKAVMIELNLWRELEFFFLN
jgi:hypothetical protein